MRKSYKAVSVVLVVILSLIVVQQIAYLTVPVNGIGYSSLAVSVDGFTDFQVVGSKQTFQISVTNATGSCSYFWYISNNVDWQLDCDSSVATITLLNDSEAHVLLHARVVDENGSTGDAFVILSASGFREYDNSLASYSYFVVSDSKGWFGFIYGDTKEFVYTSTSFDKVISFALGNCSSNECVYLTASSYSRSIVNVPNGVRLAVEKGTTGLVFLPETGATCLINNYNNDNDSFYFKGSLLYTGKSINELSFVSNTNKNYDYTLGDFTTSFANPGFIVYRSPLSSNSDQYLCQVANGTIMFSSTDYGEVINFAFSNKESSNTIQVVESRGMVAVATTPVVIPENSCLINNGLITTQQPITIAGNNVTIINGTIISSNFGITGFSYGEIYCSETHLTNIVIDSVTVISSARQHYRGIYLLGVNSVLIRNCDISNFGLDGIRIGDYDDFSSNIFVFNNHVWNNGNLMGVYPMVLGNGISLYSVVNATMVNNKVINNGQNGIRVDTCELVSEFDNICSYNRDCGTFYNYTTNVFIINGNYTANSKAGVKCIYTFNSITIAKNQINDNLDRGLSMWNNHAIQILTNCLVDNNRITGNGGNSGNLYIGGAAGCNITNNFISDGFGNYAGGIMLDYCSEIIIEENQVLNNNPCGIGILNNSILPGDNVIICKNKISFSDNSGLRANFAKNCMVLLNQFSSNVNSGISVEKGSNNLFAFNIFDQNTGETTIGFDFTDDYLFNHS